MHTSTVMQHLLPACMVLCAAGAAQAQSGNFCIVRTPGLQGSYSGDCEAGLANGRGRAVGTDRYEGGFRDGQPQGPGAYTFADGRRLEGEFSAGRMNGRGRLVYPAGDVLEGEFRENLLFGIGRLTRINGEVQSVQQQGAQLAVMAAPVVPVPAPAPAAAPQAPPGLSAGPVPGPVPMSPGTERRPEAVQCGDRLRMEVLGLARSGPGLVQLTVTYQNLGNVDLKLAVNHEAYRRDRSYLIDNAGETWQMLGPRDGGGRGADGLVFLPNTKTRVNYSFQRVNGGQDVQSFILQNPAEIYAAHGGSVAGVRASCRFEVRAIPFFGALGN